MTNRLREILGEEFEKRFDPHETPEYRRAAVMQAAALAAMSRIRSETIEEAAKVCEAEYDNSHKASQSYDGGAGEIGYGMGCTNAATAIRALSNTGEG